MNGQHLRIYVVDPTLRYLEPVIPYSAGAVELVMGTAAVESGLSALQQIGGGPARGLWQIEPATHADCWENYISFRTDLREKLMGLLAPWPSRVDQLRSNLAYAAAMCRVIYRRSPLPVPDADDIEAQGRTWKTVYNTMLGAGTVDKYLRAYALVRPHVEQAA